MADSGRDAPGGDGEARGAATDDHIVVGGRGELLGGNGGDGHGEHELTSGVGTRLDCRPVEGSRGRIMRRGGGRCGAGDRRRERDGLRRREGAGRARERVEACPRGKSAGKKPSFDPPKLIPRSAPAATHVIRRPLGGQGSAREATCAQVVGSKRLSTRCWVRMSARASRAGKTKLTRPHVQQAKYNRDHTAYNRACSRAAHLHIVPRPSAVRQRSRTLHIIYREPFGVRS